MRTRTRALVSSKCKALLSYEKTPLPLHQCVRQEEGGGVRSARTEEQRKGGGRIFIIYTLYFILYTLYFILILYTLYLIFYKQIDINKLFFFFNTIIETKYGL